MGRRGKPAKQAETDAVANLQGKYEERCHRIPTLNRELAHVILGSCRFVRCQRLTGEPPSAVTVQEIGLGQRGIGCA
jgi:hypothetical protein